MRCGLGASPADPFGEKIRGSVSDRYSITNFAREVKGNPRKNSIRNGPAFSGNRRKSGIRRDSLPIRIPDQTPGRSRNSFRKKTGRGDSARHLRILLFPCRGRKKAGGAGSPVSSGRKGNGRPFSPGSLCLLSPDGRASGGGVLFGRQCQRDCGLMDLRKTGIRRPPVFHQPPAGGPPRLPDPEHPAHRTGASGRDFPRPPAERRKIRPD